ncbi:hypothetical protein [Natronosalvus caseinilyticus]|uniref:hypothetical protein n=1 Tax=Natronosalvus caseinilyticus TaxID=2953747 RepID=UPI0028A8B895|nr:hypothetical protein [Natronosalvus caseinilyticus]
MSDEEIVDKLDDIVDEHREQQRALLEFDTLELQSMSCGFLANVARLKAEKGVLEARVQELEDLEQQRRFDDFASNSQ